MQKHSLTDFSAKNPTPARNEGYSDPDLNRARLALQLSFSVSYDVVDADTGHGRELDGLPDLKGIDSKIDPAPADWVDAVSFKVNLDKKAGS